MPAARLIVTHVFALQVSAGFSSLRWLGMIRALRFLRLIEFLPNLRQSFHIIARWVPPMARVRKPLTNEETSCPAGPSKWWPPSLFCMLDGGCSTLAGLGYILVLMGLFTFIFSVSGMQLFGGAFTDVAVKPVRRLVMLGNPSLRAPPSGSRMLLRLMSIIFAVATALALRYIHDSLWHHISDHDFCELWTQSFGCRVG